MSVCGFLSTFNNTPDIFINRQDLNGYHDYLVVIIKIMLILTINASIANNYNVMRLSFKCIFYKNEEIPKRNDIISIIISILLSNLLGLYVNDIGIILSLVSGISATYICYLIPILIDIKKSKGKRLIFNILLSSFLIVIACACTCKGIVDLVH